MSKRILIGVCAVALLGAACGKLPQGSIAYGAGTQFVPNVADSLDDVGLGNAVALDKDGVPYVSYLGFVQKPAPKIPQPRPLLNPSVPGVLLVSEKGGIWTRGAVVQSHDAPSGIVYPYGPQTEKSVGGYTPSNTNGSDVAIDPSGGRHVVWTAPDGVWYAGGDPFAAEVVEKAPQTLTQAGPIGRPAVAVDAAGTPWVAYTQATGPANQVQVAQKSTNGWQVQTAVEFPLCSGCPQPGNTQIAVTSAGPVVAYIDTSTKSVMVASPAPGQTAGLHRRWTTQTVTTGVTGTGLNMAVAADGTLYLTYYSGKGTVELATGSNGAWTTTKVADVTDPDPSAQGNTPWTTGVAVDSSGKVSVAWYDAGTKSVKLASGTGSSLAVVATPGTQGGEAPALGVTSDGSRTYLSWYDTGTTALMVGILGEVDGLVVAQPSPTPTVLATSAPVAACKPTGTSLAIAASGLAFDQNCLAAPVGQAFTIAFDNKDSGVPHNVTIVNGTNTLYAGATVTGPTKTTYNVPALQAGTYKFLCTVHPTTMFGTFVVSK